MMGEQIAIELIALAVRFGGDAIRAMIRRGADGDSSTCGEQVRKILDAHSTQSAVMQLGWMAGHGARDE
jgi:hypothetical protein